VADNLGDGLVVGLAAQNQDVTLDHNTVTGNNHDGIDNSGDNTVITGNTCKKNGGNDLAGTGDGGGTVDNASAGNVFVNGGLDQPGLVELPLPLP
jgi:hypothetical protein